MTAAALARAWCDVISRETAAHGLCGDSVSAAVGGIYQALSDNYL